MDCRPKQGKAGQKTKATVALSGLLCALALGMHAPSVAFEENISTQLRTNLVGLVHAFSSQAKLSH
jgi:hypothetical protein